MMVPFSSARTHQPGSATRCSTSCCPSRARWSVTRHGDHTADLSRRRPCWLNMGGARDDAWEYNHLSWSWSSVVIARANTKQRDVTMDLGRGGWSPRFRRLINALLEGYVCRPEVDRRHDRPPIRTLPQATDFHHTHVYLVGVRHPCNDLFRAWVSGMGCTGHESTIFPMSSHSHWPTVQLNTYSPLENRGLCSTLFYRDIRC
jgi:hypothetical protein